MKTLPLALLCLLPLAAHAQIVTSNGPPTGTSGHTVPYQDGANTWSGGQTFSSFIQPRGTLVYSGTQGPSNSSIWMNQSLSGTASDSSNYNWNLFQIDDNLAQSTYTTANGFTFHVKTDSGMNGARGALVAKCTDVATSGNFALGQQYNCSALQSFFTALVNEGGTGLTIPTSSGVGWALNTVAVLGGTATNWRGITGYEDDIGFPSGTSGAQKVGMEVVKLSTDASQGALIDTGYLLVSQSQSSKTYFSNGFMFGTGLGQWPFDSTSTAINFVQGQNWSSAPTNLNWVMDAFQVTSTSGFLRATGFSVDGSGNMQQGACVIGSNGTGIQTTCPGSVMTAGTLSAGGTGYAVNETFYFGSGGMGHVTTQSGGVVTGIVIDKFPVLNSTSLPTNPVATTAALVSGGSGLTINETWSTNRNTITEGGTNDTVKIAAGNGEVIGSATGGAQGVGTVNATGVYINGVAIPTTVPANTNLIFFNGSGGTYTESAGVKWIQIKACGTGGSAGSGALALANVAASGGGGGGAAGCGERWFRPADISSPVTVTVGAAPAGGTAPGSAGAGNAGTAGTQTVFGTYFACGRGGLGAGGQITATASGGGGAGMCGAPAASLNGGDASGATLGSSAYNSNGFGAVGNGSNGSGGASGVVESGSGGAGSGTTGGAFAGGPSATSAAGGGSGGGLTAIDASNNGGGGGRAFITQTSQVAGGTSGTPTGANATATVPTLPGGGGGGGFGNGAGNSGNGGNGIQGGGGGGGGSADGANTPGNGGPGGAGFLLVTEYF